MIQQAREQLAAAIEELDDRWLATTDTTAKLNATLVAQILHAPPRIETFRSQRVDIPVLWWVNEGNKAAAVGEMYDSLSWADDSLIRQLCALPWIEGATVSSVGPRIEGPTGFVAAETSFRIKLDLLPGS